MYDLLSSNFVGEHLYHFCDIARFWSKIADFNLLHLCLACSLGVTLLEFRSDVFWRQKTTVPGLLYGVLCVILSLAFFVQYRRVMAGVDRRTDTHVLLHNGHGYILPFVTGLGYAEGSSLS